MAHTIRTVPALAWTALSLSAIPLIALFVFRAVPAWDRFLFNASLHFWIVSVTALLAAGVCGLLVLSARSIRETRVLFLALSFLTLAMVFAVHGLATPGQLFHHSTGALERSPWLSILVGGFFAALSAVSLPGQRAARLRLPAMVFATVVALTLGYFAVSLLWPNWLRDFPSQERWFQYTLATAVIWLLSTAAWHYGQSYLFTHLPAQLAVAVAMVWLAGAQLSLLFGLTFQISWWLYHGLFLGGFLIVTGAWLWEWRRAGDLHAIADAIAMRDALRQLDRGRPGLAVALAREIEDHDEDTSRHVDRVAAYAYAMGRELGLGPATLREVVLGAQLHDLGKIFVPRQILQKPGKLTAEEFTIIKTHPARGAELLRLVPSMRGVADLVLTHHERPDGHGYPVGLAGGNLPLEARICAVADAFDVMTHGRVYQAARSVADAMAELRRCQDSQFDARCVEALQAALDAGLNVDGLAQAPGEPAGQRAFDFGFAQVA